MNKFITTLTLGFLTAGSLSLGMVPKANAYTTAQTESGRAQNDRSTLVARVYCITDSTGQYCEDDYGNWYYIDPYGNWILVTR
jgi:hypothetical protein